MFHIRTLNIYTCLVNQQVHTDKMCFYLRVSVAFGTIIKLLYKNIGKIQQYNL
jgi:hypothetical protein